MANLIYRGEDMKRKNNLAYICSPYRGKYKERNIAYAKYLTLKALEMNYAPSAVHLYLTEFLDDNDPEQRQIGLRAGREILKACETIIIGIQYGISEGMREEIEAAADKQVIMLK